MNARASFLPNALSFTLSTAVLVGCGGGAFYGEAPGPIFEEPPPTNTDEPDAGKQPEVDSGPPPTPTDGGCVTVTTPVTPEDDLSAFVEHNVASYFGGQCAACHNTQDAPTGRKDGWGPTEATSDGWFDAVTTLLAQPDQASLPSLETSFYRAFDGSFTVQQTFHKKNEAAMAAAEAWFTAREGGGTETVCPDAGPDPEPGVDSGPGPGPDPGDCTPTIPTKAESEARFVELNVSATFANCAVCHAGTGKSHTGTGQAWGTPTPIGSVTATDWHNAVWDLTNGERASVTVETSSLYRYLDGDGTHVTYAAARDASAGWLEYVLNGEPPAGCPQ